MEGAEKLEKVVSEERKSRGINDGSQSSLKGKSGEKEVRLAMVATYSSWRQRSWDGGVLVRRATVG